MEKKTLGISKSIDWSLDFLPDYLSIRQTPPSRVGRSLGWIICSFFVLIILWACFMKVDIIAEGKGKLVIASGTSIVQASRLGQVRSIYVKNGDRVTKGQLLIQLDDDEFQVRAESIKQLMKDTRIDIARLKALQAQDAEYAFEPPEGLSEEEIAAARDRLRTTLFYFQTQVEALKQDQVKKGQPKLQDASLRVQAFTSEFREKNHRFLADAQRRLSELKASLAEVEEALDSHQLIAPVTGMVQELGVQTPGAVVQPTQKVLLIVPESVTFQAQVMIASKDRGFVHQGQSVDLKVDSYPYTRFGTIEGKVEHIGQDAVVLDNQGLFFPALVSVDKTGVSVEGKTLPVLAGMQVSASIKTGKRRVISYLLSPLEAYQSESLRER